MNELYDNVDYDNIKFEYIGPTKDASFYEYRNSKELLNAIKNNQIKFDDTLKIRKELLNKISDAKQVKKLPNKKKRLIILINFTIPEMKFSIFLETVLK